MVARLELLKVAQKSLAFSRVTWTRLRRLPLRQAHQVTRIVEDRIQRIADIVFELEASGYADEIPGCFVTLSERMLAEAKYFEPDRPRSGSHSVNFALAK